MPHVLHIIFSLWFYLQPTQEEKLSSTYAKKKNAYVLHSSYQE